MKLPIPFDGAGNLEVDLLCAEARVAVELDGAQHLADRVAYRRDRRKDQLLQESGYLVLRFLAEDLGRELDAVLDAILRALSHRASSGSRSAPIRSRRTTMRVDVACCVPAFGVMAAESCSNKAATSALDSMYRMLVAAALDRLARVIVFRAERRRETLRFATIAVDQFSGGSRRQPDVGPILERVTGFHWRMEDAGSNELPHRLPGDVRAPLLGGTSSATTRP